MESFDEVLERYTPMIYHMIRSLHIYKNEEEYFQTGAIALWQAWERFDPAMGEFSSYAYPYIKGRMMTDMTRHNKVEERSVYPDDSFWAAAEEGSGEDRPLELALLLSYCAGLTAKQKQYVIDAFYFGMSVPEIARGEGVSVTAVRKRQAGALKKIRANIENRVIW